MLHLLELDGVASVGKAAKIIVQEPMIINRRLRRLSMKRISFEENHHAAFMDFVSSIRFFFSKLQSLKIDDKIAILIMASSNFRSLNVNFNDVTYDPQTDLFYRLYPSIIEQKKNWLLFIDNLITNSRKGIIKQINFLDLSHFGSLLYDSQFDKIATLLPFLANLESVNISGTDISWTSLENMRETVLPFNKLNIIDIRRCKLLLLSGNPEEFFRQTPCIVFSVRTNRNEEQMRVAATTENNKTSFWILDSNIKVR